MICSFGNSLTVSSLPSKMICELRTLTFHEANFVTRGTELLSNSLFRNKLNNHNLNETIARSYWPWRYSKPWSNFCYHNIPPQLPQVATSGGAPPRPLKINDNIPPQLPPVLTSATGKSKTISNQWFFFVTHQDIFCFLHDCICFQLTPWAYCHVTSTLCRKRR